MNTEPLFDSLPHSRACGWRQHEHGVACHPNCPTCHGMSDEEYARSIADAQTYRRHARAARLRQNHE